MTTKIEDPYSLEDGGGDFGDFFNEVWSVCIDVRDGWTDTEWLEFIKAEPRSSVGARYARDPDMLSLMEVHPRKVERIDKLVQAINSCTTVTSLKPLLNELHRVLYGKSTRLWFPEPEFNPDLVKL